jgi:AAA domain-containing protein
MSRLILIGGPPAVGKSTVLAHLQRKLERGAFLDADDVWRVKPFDVSEPYGALFGRNVNEVLRGYLEARLPLVLLSWVFANPELVKRVLDGVAGLYQTHQIIYLVASPEALAARHRADPEQARLLDYGLAKLAQIQALPEPKLDTTGLSPERVADRLIELLGLSEFAPDDRPTEKRR